MRPLIILAPFALVTTALAYQTDLGSFEPLLRALSELPLVGAMAWILMRQQDRHQQMIESLTNHWLARARERDAFYQQLLTDAHKTIEELAKK